MRNTMKPVDPNQALLDAIVAQRNAALNELAKAQAELSVANGRIAALQERLAATLEKSAEAMMRQPGGEATINGLAQPSTVDLP